MKKLCIFDFDGTIFNSIDDVAKCFDKTLHDLGFTDAMLKDYKSAVGGNVNEIITLILKEQATEENIVKVKKAYEELYYNDPKENTKPYPGMKELLEKLEDMDVILAINSNRKPDSINHFVKKYLDNITFIDIQGHVKTNPSKPDPYGVNMIIEKAKVTRQDTVYIGDSITDIKTAKNAEIDCILVNWGYGMEDDYKDSYPLKIVNNAEEILDLIIN